MAMVPALISTRGEAAKAEFGDVLLAGPAPDGGLYLPERWPQVSPEQIAGFKSRSYAAVALEILSLFAADTFAPDEFAADVASAYAGFSDARIAPLVEIGSGLFLLELFHGPTLAFKDIAMQVLGRLFARALAKRGGRATVVVATSGDTGAAAIAALGGLAGIELFVLHPKERVSEVQRRQMTTSPHANVHNIALEGTFDDAQAIVKELFADTNFAHAVNMTAVNSINFARIAAQCVYYFTATAQLGRPATFVVPTGNFGDVFAGEAAARMGLAIEKLVIATNENDIVARALNEGVYALGRVHPSLSPAMDIQVASNFERALFEASDRDAAWVRKAMAAFARDKALAIPASVLAKLRSRYAAAHCDDRQTLETIRKLHAETGRLIDPHTAVALHAAYGTHREPNIPVVVLSTAHPAKFPDAVREATGVVPALPPRLAGLYDGTERYTVLGNDRALVRAHIEAKLAGQ
ncbi:MAG TPA: threonine synthase [Rhizomicrobium sp.]|nr:threonine synthase [Rhizomicrobium sp.]